MQHQLILSKLRAKRDPSVSTNTSPTDGHMLERYSRFKPKAGLRLRERDVHPNVKGENGRVRDKGWLASSFLEAKS